MIVHTEYSRAGQKG